MEHCLTKQSMSSKSVCFFYLFLLNVSCVPVSVSFGIAVVRREVSKCCTHVYVMWCVLHTGSTFRPFRLTLPGFGGWRCRGQTEVICRSDPLSRLWDSTTELTGLRYLGPYLVFGFPSSLFFCAHMALYDICPSAFSQINTMRWARSSPGDGDYVDMSISGVEQNGKMCKSAHDSQIVAIFRLTKPCEL